MNRVIIYIKVLQPGGESAWDQNHPGCPWLNADCDDDHAVTFADIDPFVALIGTTCP